MINKSKKVAALVFYIGVGTASLFGSGSISYILGLPEYSVEDFWVIIFGIIPAIIGLAMVYMGSYMRSKNRRFKRPRRR